MIVVSDTGPINYLILTGYVDVLHQLYGRVIIPEAVYVELTRDATPQPVRQWVENKPEWLEVHAVMGNLITGLLDCGEQEALTLAITLNADLILMDERQGRAIAKNNGVIVTGTLGVLADAAGAGIISLPDAVEKLRRTSMRLSERLIERVLRLDR